MPNTPSLSVIINTSEGRADNLNYTLKMLQKQTFQDFEVLIIDDGSSDCEHIAEKHLKHLKMRYFHRDNDCNVSPSRNLGAQAALSEHLVMLDVDLMLNPHALAAYQGYLEHDPQAMVSGYAGLQRDFVAPSQFFPERLVNYIAPQFMIYSRESMKGSKYLYHYPYWYAGCNNFCIHRKVFNAVDGFNEKLIGWGLEDSEFAYRLSSKGFEQHLSLEAWGEHQEHERKSNFHSYLITNTENAGNPNYKYKRAMFLDKPIPYTLKIMGHPERTPEFMQQIFDHYLQHDINMPQAQKKQLLQTGALLDLGMDGNALNNKYEKTEPYLDCKLNFFLPSPAFTGSKFLAQFLQAHPEILPAPRQRRHFFTLPYKRYSYLHYLESLNYQPNKKLFDFSSRSFSHPHAPELMSQVSPKMKLIFLLREPIERACSEYILTQRISPKHFTEKHLKAMEQAFQKTLKSKEKNPSIQNIHLEEGLYYDSLKKYFNHFPQEQILLLNFDRFKNNPEQILKQCFEFLELKSPQKIRLPLIPQDLPNDLVQHLNPELKKSLDAYYLASNNALQQQLKHNFNWLNPN